MSVYAQLLEVLSDGNWHTEDDLRPITPPASGLTSFGMTAMKWQRTLRAPVVRLRQDAALA